jgi:alpha-amylase
MPKLKFIFGVHNHQPVGNFDFVFEDAYQKAYKPFLDVVSGHPWFRFTLHNSGCLWEWLEQHHPEYLEQVNTLVRAGQMELLGGGFYEPIMPAIPDRDKQGQLKMMSEYLKNRFGQTPAGAWLAERVWEPGLASVLAGAGIKYTVLDDYHFKCSGKNDEDLDGHYITEDQGQPLAVFPISQQLRYLVPFHNVDEVIAHLKTLHQPDREALAVLADDGEKFGVWPGTHELAYEKGWLKDFLTALEANKEWLELSTFSRALEALPARGRIYLPTASYAEMGEWALEPKSEAVYSELTQRLKSEGSYQRYSPFVKGGTWRDFLTKYPESNNIYRKMLSVSAKAAGQGPDILRELYRGQCNCGYWHGVFGGLYLPHLREALYKHLIRAENLIESKSVSTAQSLEVREFDFDGDGQNEVELTNRHHRLCLSPAAGGSLVEWDVREKEINLFDTLARRPESYHRNIPQPGDQSASQGKSIHEMLVSKEEGLTDLLFYDSFRRVGLVDHLLGPETDPESFYRNCHREQEPGLNGAWVHHTNRQAEQAAVELTKRLKNLTVAKKIIFGTGPSFRIEYSWLNSGLQEMEIWPGIEFNFGLLSSGFGRHCRSASQILSTEALNVRAQDQDISQLSVIDNHRGFSIDFNLEEAWDLWRFPVETVSQSESGLERNYQGSCFLWNKRMRLWPGRQQTLIFTLEHKAI